MTKELQLIVAKGIAFISCHHSRDRPCWSCLKRYEREVDKINTEILLIVATAFEPETKKPVNFTPLTWLGAFNLTREIMKVIK